MNSPPRRYSLLVYLEESARPLVSLLFVLPILLTYEIGVRVINLDKAVKAVNGADAILKRAFQSFGFYGSALSAMAVILTLIFLHLHRRNPWKFQTITLAGMCLESMIIAVPIFFLERAVNAVLLMAAGVTQTQALVHTAIYSLGAGVYEEYLFRLILVGLILAFGKSISKKQQTLQWVGILISAILFSAFHHLGAYGDAWDLRIFAFRTVVGVYFAWIYTARGFGIAVGCHTAYDLMVIALRLL